MSNDDDIYGKGFVDVDIGGAGFNFIGLGTGTLGSRTACSFTLDSGFTNNVGDHMYNASYSILHEPSTTSELKYRYGGYYAATSHWLGVNMTSNDTDTADTPRTSSSITAMEILA